MVSLGQGGPLQKCSWSLDEVEMTCGNPCAGAAAVVGCVPEGTGSCKESPGSWCLGARGWFC